ncbi:hypothetical protein CpB0985 [Chlamydia pneumoniae TW-183]|uniref:Uncharacterized protein n=1 Tax=Chlamydia pneumoniae TaxID=83558 RepID=A0ABM5LDH7_CHLPN|nr:hypothetical protein CpB0985 [Chlamydia pneumoniae TW-183]
MVTVFFSCLFLQEGYTFNSLIRESIDFFQTGDIILPRKLSIDVQDMTVIGPLRKYVWTLRVNA